MRRPAIVSARFSGLVAELWADDPRVDWDDKAFVICRRDYFPIRHHEGTADEVARWLRFAQEGSHR
jgi:hypothetical protein